MNNIFPPFLHIQYTGPRQIYNFSFCPKKIINFQCKNSTEQKICCEEIDVDIIFKVFLYFFNLCFVSMLGDTEGAFEIYIFMNLCTNIPMKTVYLFFYTVFQSKTVFSLLTERGQD